MSQSGRSEKSENGRFRLARQCTIPPCRPIRPSSRNGSVARRFPATDLRAGVPGELYGRADCLAVTRLLRLHAIDIVNHRKNSHPGERVTGKVG